MNIKRSNFRPRLAALLGTAAILTSGCQILETQDTPAPQQPVLISRGMSTDQIIALLGEPEKVEKVGIDTHGDEWWTYRFVRASDVRMKPVHTTKRPIIDPLTGAYREVDEPYYVPEVVEETQTVKILLQADQVLRWTTESKKKTQLQE